MKASGWIDRIKAARGWDSDYRVAQELGVGRATVSKYRQRDGTLDEDMAIKVAGVLGERPEAVLLDQYAERTKNPEVRTALSRAARDLCILC
ncbi:helix-turn-helix domain-containing protein [Polaromonas sp.]|uniref:helix-turn-helix domain-containing protein n=1 Tax=Polaromonas sp. TaxID=1869339 RepID=UPI003C8D8805